MSREVVERAICNTRVGVRARPATHLWKRLGACCAQYAPHRGAQAARWPPDHGDGAPAARRVCLAGRLPLT